MTYHKMRKALRISYAVVSILLTSVEIRAIFKEEDPHKHV